LSQHKTSRNCGKDQPWRRFPLIYLGGVATAAVTAKSLYGVDGLSPDSGFLQLYNKAGSPVVGTDPPVMTLPVVGGAPFSYKFPEGVTFSSGIGVALSRYRSPVAGDVIANAIVADLRYS
jgi:hypothetical protein